MYPHENQFRSSTGVSLWDDKGSFHSIVISEQLRPTLARDGTGSPSFLKAGTPKKRHVRNDPNTIHALPGGKRDGGREGGGRGGGGVTLK